MSQDDPLHAERVFVVAIEETLQQLRGKPVVISPADLERVLDWFRREIPLHLILRTMESLGARATQGRRHSRPRSLAYFEEAVEDAFSALQRARVGAERNVAALPIPTLASLLRGAAESVDRSSAPVSARASASQALRELAEGRGWPSPRVDVVSSIDSELLEACRRCLSDEDLRLLEASVEQEIAPFLLEMSPRAQSRARELARVRLLRQRFELPDLSLLPLFGGDVPP
ncbi:MAG: hypothetical protein U0V87_10230 [Acidobacteriota bacterium]